MEGRRKSGSSEKIQFFHPLLGMALNSNDRLDVEETGKWDVEQMRVWRKEDSRSKEQTGFACERWDHFMLRILVVGYERRG